MARKKSVRRDSIDDEIKKSIDNASGIVERFRRSPKEIIDEAKVILPGVSETVLETASNISKEVENSVRNTNREILLGCRSIIDEVLKRI